ncbi:MAG TPA: hypothetical protein VN783_07920, partial [Thermoanaerobaculia bacterium]|nr:hypothetical protein [Thermoanaerobaculia bacterium]
LTLVSLKKRLGRPGETQAAARSAPLPLPKPNLPATPPLPVAPLRMPATPPAPPAAQTGSPAPARPAPSSPSVPNVPSAPPPAAVPPAQTPAGLSPRPAAKPLTASAARRTVDVLSELEKIRREAASPSRPSVTVATGPGSPSGAAPPSSPQRNGRGELSRSIELTLKKADFQRARRFLVSFQVEDDQHHVMDAVRDLEVDIRDAAQLERVLLRLNIALHAKE